MTNPSSRMLRLLTLLQTHRFWPGGELSRRLEVSQRTLRRDVDRLRELGYEIDATRGVAGGYQLRAGSDLPPLLLDDEEAVAIAVGLRTAAGGSVSGIEETSVRALAKLEQVLPAHLRRRVNALQTSMTPVLFPSRLSVDASVLALIAQACRDSERLQFDYRRRDGEAATRSVEPHRLVFYGRRWYLVAYDSHRQDWRTFRVDRLREPRTSGARFVERALPATDAAAFVRESIRSMPRSYEAVATVWADAETVRPRARWFGATVEEIDAGSCRVLAAGDSVAWLAAGLAMLELDFEVHEPPELARWLDALGERIGRARRAAGDRGSPP